MSASCGSGSAAARSSIRALLKDEGLRVLLPWDKLFLYDLRLQTTTDTYNAISKDGVNLAATINIRFRLKHDAIPQLHQAIGPDYIARMLRPEIGNRAREIIAEYTAEEVYSTKRQEIQKRIRTHTEAMLGQSMIQRTEQESEYGEHYRVSLDEMLILYDTLVLGLELPQTVVAAINRKVEQYYLVQEYAFRVDRERKESERKQIEAYGIRDFQQTVTQGISDSYVRWRGIEATLQLAQSPNTKIVIIGSGKDGLPVILGNVDTPIAPQPPAGGTTRARQQRSREAEARGCKPAAAGEDAGEQSADAGGTARAAVRTGRATVRFFNSTSRSGAASASGRARPAVVRAKSGARLVVDADDLGIAGTAGAGFAQQRRDDRAGSAAARRTRRSIPACTFIWVCTAFADVCTSCGASHEHASAARPRACAGPVAGRPPDPSAIAGAAGFRIDACRKRLLALLAA